jgi:hypothetical protein
LNDAGRNHCPYCYVDFVCDKIDFREWRELYIINNMNE